MNDTCNFSINPSERQRYRSGFTLVELLVALAILSVVSAVSFGIFVSLSRGYARTNVAAESQQDLRLTMDFMIREIRMAGLDPLKTRTFGVSSALDNNFAFTADRNLNGDLESPDEETTYQFTGDALTVSLGGVTDTLCDGITDFAFTYFDADGAVTNDPERVRSVGIRMTKDNPAGGGQQVVRTYRTLVRCRNLGL
jgi:type IV pilus assembly protein PilW